MFLCSGLFCTPDGCSQVLRLSHGNFKSLKSNLTNASRLPTCPGCLWTKRSICDWARAPSFQLNISRLGTLMTVANLLSVSIIIYSRISTGEQGSGVSHLRILPSMCTVPKNTENVCVDTQDIIGPCLLQCPRLDEDFQVSHGQMVYSQGTRKQARW